MVLPLRDILSVETSKGSRFGHYGLIIIIKGHEELFFEFSAEDRRTSFVELLEKQLDDVKLRIAAAVIPVPSQEALLLEEFDTAGHRSVLIEGPRPVQDEMTQSVPAIMFTSDSSTFLTFKPTTSLRFTFLTIGSRGDVQPSVALALGCEISGNKLTKNADELVSPV